MPQASLLDPAVATTVARWHRMIANRDLSEVSSLMCDGVEFRSPAFWKPHAGPAKVSHVLQTVMTIFESFAYHREFVTADGAGLVLEFSARIGDLELKGIDMIGFDQDGLMERFEVMVRPMKSLKLLAERMGAGLDPIIMA